jgi:hypothetical protein
MIDRFADISRVGSGEWPLIDSILGSRERGGSLRGRRAGGAKNGLPSPG